MIRTRISAWVLTAAVAVAGALCVAGPSQAQNRGSVVAVVNDDIITAYDLQQQILLMIGRSGVKPTQETIPELRQQALYTLIDQRLKLQELRHQEEERKMRGKIIINDDEVDAEIKDLAERNKITSAQYMNVLKSWGVDPETERNRIRADKSWVYWISGFYGRRIKISQADIDSTLAEIAARSSKPSYLLGEIFIDAARTGGQQKAMDLANQLVGQIQKNTPFQDIAGQFSALPTAATGGDAGWLANSEMRPEVAAVVEQMRPGQLSPPIPVSDGVFLIYLRDKKTGGGAPVVSLKQVALPVAANASAADVDAANRKLLALKPKLTSCSTFEQVAGTLDGAAAGDLGEAEVKDLSPQFRAATDKLQVNQVSDPIRTDVGLHLVAVCGRRDSSVQLPSRDEVRSELENQKMSLIARREILNLRSAATIETR